MTAPDLLSALHAQGATVRADGGNLHVAPADALTPELTGEIRRLKPQLLKLLAENTMQAPDPDALLLARWRSLGVVLWLDEMQKDGDWWLALRFDAPNYSAEGANLLDGDLATQIAKDAYAIAHALQAEQRALDQGDPIAPTSAGELAAICAIISRERRGGAFLVNTEALRAVWRRLSALLGGLKLTSRHLWAFVEVTKQNEGLTPIELLEWFHAGVQPDEGGGVPVWISPESLFKALFID